jgi:hypothetical protein
VKQVLDRDLVAAVTEQAMRAACKRGWVDRDGRASVAMRGRRFEDTAPEYVAFLAEVLGSSDVDTLRRSPGLLKAVSTACGTTLIPIRADICRITFPGEAHGTPVHQDRWYCKAPGLWIAWIPLVDCPEALGALEVAEPEPMLADHDAAGLTGAPGTGWRAMPCTPGDVLLFSGLTPHRSRPNRSADRPRLSLDLRFAREAA